MNVKRLDVLVYCVVFTAIGATGGWIAARQGRPVEGAAAHAGEAGAKDAANRVLSVQTLRNLGITTGVAQPTDFVKYRSIPAVIERTPFNEQPVFAPIGGRVLDVLAKPGTVVSAGDTLLTMVRDPIPRPTLTLTEGVIKPAREEIHQAVVELRRAGAELQILDTEMERVTKYTGNVGGDELPILPRQTIIDLRYSLLRTQRALDQSRLELSKHGFTDEQIDAIAAGAAIPNLGQENWLRALIANGLWTEAAQELFAALPEELRTQRWTIATVGELAAAGLVRPGFIAWIRELGDDCAHFLEIGALLQTGYSVDDLRILHQLNALDAIVSIKAPGEGKVPDWNVELIRVKAGARVVTGDQLVSLLDPREMYLRTDPVGGEKSDVLRSVADGAACEAWPLVRDSGPILKDVTIDFITSESSGKGTIAYATVTNTVLAAKTRADGAFFRSWQLREGLKYVIRVPTRQLDHVFVIPSAAVAEDGPRKIVFIPDGDAFRQVEVEISYQDDEVAVIAINKDTQVFPGDAIVTGGAYSLGLALKSGPAVADPHAGHNH